VSCSSVALQSFSPAAPRTSRRSGRFRATVESARSKLLSLLSSTRTNHRSVQLSHSAWRAPRAERRAKRAFRRPSQVEPLARSSRDESRYRPCCTQSVGEGTGSVLDGKARADARAVDLKDGHREDEERGSNTRLEPEDAHRPARFRLAPRQLIVRHAASTRRGSARLAERQPDEGEAAHANPPRTRAQLTSAEVSP